MKSKKPLNELISMILVEMENAQFSDETRRQYRDVYRRLQKLANAQQEMYYNKQLGQVFIEDCNYVGTKEFSHHRFYFHKRCVHILETLVYTGFIDWSQCLSNENLHSFVNPHFNNIYADYIMFLKEEGMKPSTICTYGRTVTYFLNFIETKGRKSVGDLRPGDVKDFVLAMCKEHWNPKCLGSYIPGMKKFLIMYTTSSVFIRELPSYMPRKKDIIEVYSDNEHEQLINYLNRSDISKRDKAISLLSIETGLRAIDIINLKLDDIDWKNEVIHLVQEKTSHAINIPLRPSYGNAMADYLLDERPNSSLKYLFLHQKAPFDKINSHTCIFSILKKVVTNAGIEKSGRINGTRMMRHNAASRMVRKGIPLPAIAEVLGHSDPNSTLIYISTDGERLSQCTLPLPGGSYE